jgi:hypothetical protein
LLKKLNISDKCQSCGAGSGAASLYGSGSTTIMRLLAAHAPNLMLNIGVVLKMSQNCDSILLFPFTFTTVLIP